ncbi:MAG TPA: hypothetical protein VNZ52_17125 [Candidatus Thermoplasmatota archaeon]|nr:hypothetical protein [Candidatus Thermoplasmatota archaeon]
MRDVGLVLLLLPVWALAPFFGSPASIWVMPLVAALAAWRAPTPGRAVRASLISLLLLVAVFPLVALGEDPGWILRQAGIALALFAFHAPFVTLYAWLLAKGLTRWPQRPLVKKHLA